MCDAPLDALRPTDPSHAFGFPLELGHRRGHRGRVVIAGVALLVTVNSDDDNKSDRTGAGANRRRSAVTDRVGECDRLSRRRFVAPAAGSVVWQGSVLLDGTPIGFPTRGSSRVEHEHRHESATSCSRTGRRPGSGSVAGWRTGRSAPPEREDCVARIDAPGVSRSCRWTSGAGSACAPTGRFAYIIVGKRSGERLRHRRHPLEQRLRRGGTTAARAPLAPGDPGDRPRPRSPRSRARPGRRPPSGAAALTARAAARPAGSRPRRALDGRVHRGDARRGTARATGGHEHVGQQTFSPPLNATADQPRAAPGRRPPVTASRAHGQTGPAPHHQHADDHAPSPAIAGRTGPAATPG